MASQARFPFPGGERALTSGAVTVVGLSLCWVGIRFWASDMLSFAGWLLFALGLPMTASGIGLWCRREWARWPAVVFLLLLVATQSWGLATKGPTFGRIALLLGFAAMAWSVHRDFSPAAFAADGELDGAKEKPLVSLVLLLRKPRHLEAGMLARYCEAAWGGSFHTLRDDEKPSVGAKGDPAAAGWVGGRSPYFFVGSNRGVFLVHNHGQAYFEDTTALADAAADLRIRQVLEENRGWLAVDSMEASTPDPEATPASLYPVMARLVAELAGPDCQAIYQPDGNRFNHWDESLEAGLRSGDVARVFDEPTRMAVSELADDDPRMLAAIDAAARLWPEFVGAFERREGTAHAVKAPLTRQGTTECIWIDVDRIENERVHGRLGNHPANLGGLRMGSVVDVSVADIRDWAYVVEGQPRGMFGTKALQDARRDRVAKTDAAG
ncbi:MAG: DUF2314 domain-containing protein [Verrucomicrobia bacterium]|nr:MAG: DUF2314 domain-containing protein [Verrucomicrobiota bacterium]